MAAWLGMRRPRFIADVEAPSEAMDTSAHGYFAQLGFSRPYARTHWARL